MNCRSAVVLVVLISIFGNENQASGGGNLKLENSRTSSRQTVQKAHFNSSSTNTSRSLSSDIRKNVTKPLIQKEQSPSLTKANITTRNSQVNSTKVSKSSSDDVTRYIKNGEINRWNESDYELKHTKLTTESTTLMPRINSRNDTGNTKREDLLRKIKAIFNISREITTTAEPNIPVSYQTTVTAKEKDNVPTSKPKEFTVPQKNISTSGSKEQMGQSVSKNDSARSQRISLLSITTTSQPTIFENQNNSKLTAVNAKPVHESKRNSHALSGPSLLTDSFEETPLPLGVASTGKPLKKFEHSKLSPEDGSAATTLKPLHNKADGTRTFEMIASSHEEEAPSSPIRQMSKLKTTHGDDTTLKPRPNNAIKTISLKIFSSYQNEKPISKNPVIQQESRRLSYGQSEKTTVQPFDDPTWKPSVDKESEKSSQSKPSASAKDLEPSPKYVKGSTHELRNRSIEQPKDTKRYLLDDKITQPSADTGMETTTQSKSILENATLRPNAIEKMQMETFVFSGRPLWTEKRNQQTKSNPKYETTLTPGNSDKMLTLQESAQNEQHSTNEKANSHDRLSLKEQNGEIKSVSGNEFLSTPSLSSDEKGTMSSVTASKKSTEQPPLEKKNPALLPFGSKHLSAAEHQETETNLSGETTSRPDSTDKMTTTQKITNIKQRPKDNSGKMTIAQRNEQGERLDNSDKTTEIYDTTYMKQGSRLQELTPNGQDSTLENSDRKKTLQESLQNKSRRTTKKENLTPKPDHTLSSNEQSGEIKSYIQDKVEAQAAPGIASMAALPDIFRQSSMSTGNDQLTFSEKVQALALSPLGQPSLLSAEHHKFKLIPSDEAKSKLVNTDKMLTEQGRAKNTSHLRPEKMKTSPFSTLGRTLRPFDETRSRLLATTPLPPVTTERANLPSRTMLRNEVFAAKPSRDSRIRPLPLNSEHLESSTQREYAVVGKPKQNDELISKPAWSTKLFEGPPAFAPLESNGPTTNIQNTIKTEQRFQCVATAPRLNLLLDKMLGIWYPAKLSATTSELWRQSFADGQDASNKDCLLMEYTLPDDNDQDILRILLSSANETAQIEAMFVGDDQHPKESKWAIAWPNGEDTLTSVVAAGVVGKERSRYSWLLTVDCDLNGIVEPDWAVMARIPEGISNSTLTTILAIVEGLKGLKVEDAITFQSDDCHK